MIVKLSLGEVERAHLVLRGGSVFDWRRLNVKSLAEGDAILRVNGFDPENEGDRACLSEIRLSAIDYLDGTLTVNRQMACNLIVLFDSAKLSPLDLLPLFRTKGTQRESI